MNECKVCGKPPRSATPTIGAVIEPSVTTESTLKLLLEKRGLALESFRLHAGMAKLLARDGTTYYAANTPLFGSDDREFVSRLLAIIDSCLQTKESDMPTIAKGTPSGGNQFSGGNGRRANAVNASMAFDTDGTAETVSKETPQDGAIKRLSDGRQITWENGRWHAIERFVGGECPACKAVMIRADITGTYWCPRCELPLLGAVAKAVDREVTLTDMVRAASDAGATIDFELAPGGEPRGKPSKRQVLVRWPFIVALLFVACIIFIGTIPFGGHAGMTTIAIEAWCTSPVEMVIGLFGIVPLIAELIAAPCPKR